MDCFVELPHNVIISCQALKKSFHENLFTEALYSQCINCYIRWSPITCVLNVSDLKQC